MAVEDERATRESARLRAKLLARGSRAEGGCSQAVRSALRLARQPEHHAALRRNARAAACDVAHTAWRWRGELLRLRTCLALRQVDRSSLHAEDVEEPPRKPATLPS